MFNTKFNMKKRSSQMPRHGTRTARVIAYIVPSGYKYCHLFRQRPGVWGVPHFYDNNIKHVMYAICFKINCPLFSTSRLNSREKNTTMISSLFGNIISTWITSTFKIVRNQTKDYYAKTHGRHHPEILTIIQNSGLGKKSL